MFQSCSSPHFRRRFSRTSASCSIVGQVAIAGRPPVGLSHPPTALRPLMGSKDCIGRRITGAQVHELITPRSLTGGREGRARRWNHLCKTRAKRSRGAAGRPFLFDTHDPPLGKQPLGDRCVLQDALPSCVSRNPAARGQAAWPRAHAPRAPLSPHPGRSPSSKAFWKQRWRLFRGRCDSSPLS